MSSIILEEMSFLTNIFLQCFGEHKLFLAQIFGEENKKLFANRLKSQMRIFFPEINT